MKPRLIVSLLLISALLLPSLAAAASAPAAPAPAPVTATATGAPQLAGDYAGAWKASDESTGALTLKLTRQGSADWVAEMVFTFDGNKVPTKLKAIRVEQAKVEMEFTWVIDGTIVQGKLTGELSGATLQGKYETDASNAGTWSATRG